MVECTYDYMGRRHTRKVSVNGTVSSYLRYMYRGYLQIAAIDAVSGVFRWFLFWDPTQPEAARPLAIRKDGAWYAYGWDLTGNVTEIFGKAGYLRTVYTYTPYGEVTAEGDVTQPIQWSSEYSDEELGLGLLQLPASQSARRKVDQPRSHRGRRWLEFVRVCRK